MRPSRPRSWGTVESSLSRVSWNAIPRPSGWGWGNWKAGTTWTRVAPEKRGWPQTVDRDQPRDRSELSQGARGPHGRRSDAARGEMDELVTASDRETNHRTGNSGQPTRRFPVAPQAPIPEAEGVEEEDDGAASQRSQRPVREHRPSQEEIFEGRLARHQHRYEKEGVAGRLLP